ncbi:hypothetical protein LOTGIDRAFT_135638 [Lottia gigantea]|uniref:Peptidase S1 domain-containing protein n=1 Tax=Lottia gigantea TaxID=225164 RepID=V3ZD24_LOTGI|nr:hypothetical protein LOTGIDRAFT_135638 [Lottia gigantea]ESO81912.1 hypothetical protein LOTGIDRAFT_135638 [Lottia gigantea]
MILQELQVNVSSVSTCRSLYGTRVSDRQVCAGNGTKQACMGDSGSPLSCNINGIWYVVGVVSWGDDNCVGRPSVFTRISQFIPWIQQQTGLHFNQNSHVIG